MMKILLVSSGSGSRGGGEIFLDYLGSALVKRGHEVIVWMPSHPRMDELARKCARFGRVVRSRYRNTYDHRTRTLATCLNPWTSARVASEWNELRPDVIHINKQNLEDGLDLLRAASETKLPSVCTIHLTQTAVYLRAAFARLRDWLSQRTLQAYPGMLVAVQETRRQEMENFLPRRGRTRTVMNGVPRVPGELLERLRADKRRELGLGDGEFLVLGIGRLVEQKNPSKWLDLAVDLHKRMNNSRFLWVGDGQLANDFKDQIKHRGLNGAISCAGWQQDVLPFLAAGDLLLHAANYEGLPFAIIEAMAAGLPCAMMKSLAAEVPLFNDRNAILIGDSTSLAALMGDRAGLRAIAQNASALVDKNFSLEAMAASYEQLYREALAQ